MTRTTDSADTPTPEVGDPMLRRLAHIVISKTVMECAKLAGHESVFASGWQIPRQKIALESVEEYFRIMLADVQREVAPRIKALIDNEGYSAEAAEAQVREEMEGI